MKFFNFNIEDDINGNAKVLARLKPGRLHEPTTQLLLADNSTLREIAFVVDDHGAYSLGPALTIVEGVLPKNAGMLWDAFSSSIVMFTTSCIQQLTHDNAVRLLAGHESESGSADGVGATARFSDIGCLTSDGTGNLYVGDGTRVRRVRMPASLRGRWFHRELEPLPAAAGPGEQVEVTTLPFEAASAIRDITLIADGNNGSPSPCLVFATGSALYRVPFHGELGQEQPVADAVLWVGNQDETKVKDGTGEYARFSAIHGFDLDADGNLFVTDGWHHYEVGVTLRKVAPSGQVTTVTAGLEKSYSPAILPNGYLALCESDALIIDLKLKPVPLVASAAPALPPPRTLPTDLGALLDRQPDGTSDLTVEVADRSFAVHRGILVARSDYFRQRLEGGFADGSSTQLSLPEADPEAFALVLRFIYTGTATIPFSLLAAVVALADRLLLPELCQAAQAQVLAEVQPETVVERLLWAAARGPNFSQLLSDLKHWCTNHREQIIAQAPDSVQRLMEERVDLGMQLFVLGKRRRLE